MTDALDEALERQEHEAKENLRKVQELRSERRGVEEAPPVAFRDLIKAPDADLHWILGGLIVPGSVNVLAAGGGAGKTTLLAQIALSLGAGRDVLGFRVYRPHTVLMVQAEGAREAFRQRLKVAARSLRIEEPDLSGFLQPEDFGNYIIRDGFIARLVGSVRADVAILDTIGYFHRGDENSTTDWKAHVMTPLRKISAEFGTAFILVHHNRKYDAKFPGDEQHRGTTAMRDDADLFLMLKKKKEADGSDIGNRTLWIDKNKYGASDVEVPLWFDREHAMYEQGHRLVPLEKMP